MGYGSQLQLNSAAPSCLPYTSVMRDIQEIHVIRFHITH